VKNADFYGLFKSAYALSFTKSNITSAFEATGIWPMDRTPVTTKFDYTTSPLQIDQIGLFTLSPADWKRTRQILVEVVKDNNDELVRRLEGAVNRASTQNKLLQLDNEGLLTSLDTKNKRTAHGRHLPLGGKKKRPTDAVFWSPRKLKEAKAEQARKDREEEDEKLQKRARTGEKLLKLLRKSRRQRRSVWNKRGWRRWRRRRRLRMLPASRQKSRGKTARKLSNLPKKVSAKLQNLCPSYRNVRNVVVVVQQVVEDQMGP
jgi:hypothetical protein